MTYNAAEAVRIAKSQVGYRERATNLTKYNDWLGTIPGYPSGGRGYPWCQAFQSWVASRAGGRANIDYPKTAGCETAVAWFKRNDRWGGRTPHVGDMVFYGPGGGTHVELVVAVSSSAVTTVGGNTSGSLGGRYFNGDGVYLKKVARSSSRIYGYGRPNYSSASQEDDMATPKELWDHEIKVPWGSPDNPEWQADSILVNNGARARNIEAKVDMLLAKVAPDVDEDAIVRGVLAALTPAAIASAVVDAMPPELAGQVVDELSARLGRTGEAEG